MDKKFIEAQKNELLRLKKNILTDSKLRGNADLVVQVENLAEEGDLAQSVVDQNLSFNLREKDRSKLHAIEEALERIEMNCYGVCEDCDEEIPQRRLEKIPTATLCIEHAEEQERVVRFKVS